MGKRECAFSICDSCRTSYT